MNLAQAIEHANATAIPGFLSDDAYLDEVLPEMDEVMLVVDPLPGRLLLGEERLRRVLMEYPDARIIVNKMNAGVHRAELRRFLGNARTTEIPFIDPPLIYRAEYSCVLPAELPAVPSCTWSFCISSRFMSPASKRWA